MSQMTGKERIEKLFKKEPIDRMPCFSGMGMVTIHAIQEMGIRFPQVHGSAEYMAHSAITTAETFGFDGVVVPYDMCTIPEALGRGASLYEDVEEILYPTVPSKWATLDEVDMPGEYLGKGRMPVVDEAIGIIASSQILLEDLVNLNERFNTLGTRYSNVDDTLAEGKSLVEMALMDVSELESRYQEARTLLLTDAAWLAFGAGDFETTLELLDGIPLGEDETAASATLLGGLAWRARGDI